MRTQTTLKRNSTRKPRSNHSCHHVQQTNQKTTNSFKKIQRSSNCQRGFGKPCVKIVNCSNVVEFLRFSWLRTRTKRGRTINSPLSHTTVDTARSHTHTPHTRTNPSEHNSSLLVIERLSMFFFAFVCNFPFTSSGFFLRFSAL
jgi:hypothetical protein